MSPAFARVVRPLLVCFGGTLIVSAAVNIFMAVQLIEVSDEVMLGITRTEVIRSMAGMGALGLAVIYLGLRWTRPRRPPELKEPPRL